MGVDRRTKDPLELEKTRRILRYLPLAIALVFGTLWAVLYLFLGRIHGMWPMFDKEFPFLLTSFLGVHESGMSPLVGGLFAFADAAFVGFLLSWFLRYLVMGTQKGESTNGEQR